MKRTNLILASLLLSPCAISAPAIASPAASDQVVRIALVSEPPNLNSTKTTDAKSQFVLGHVIEGLVRYGKNGKILPGVAESWKVDEKGATFNLRKNALWSDGKPVTAQDFVFAWRTVVDPKNASPYAFAMFPVKNGEKVFKGSMPLTDLGVSAPDAHTVKVVFEKPTPYFLGLAALFTYLPIREDFYKAQNGKYAVDAKNLLFNGPFTLTSWVHGASLSFEKNPKYWDASRVQLAGIEIPYITSDTGALYNFFKDGKIDLLDAIQKDDFAKAMSANYKIQSFPNGGISFLDLNFREGRPTANANLRKAIRLVINRDELIHKVVGIPGVKPLYGLIPTWVPGKSKSFRSEYALAAEKPNYAEAKKLIEKAKAELGGHIPPLTWLTDDRPAQAAEAEYFQQIFRQQLGLELKIDKQIFKQRLAKSVAGDFDLISSNWTPDFGDAMTYADLRTSWNENNREKYSNPEHDKAIREAQATTDSKKRYDAMARAEKILLDDVGMIPLYERVTAYLTSPKLEGVVRNVIGPDPDFSSARVVTKQ